jgi:hypothetical protein
VEIVPDCYKLEPGDRLTVIYEALDGIDSLEVNFLNEQELVIWPGGTSDRGGIFELEVLINGKSAEGLSWAFNKPS